MSFEYGMPMLRHKLAEAMRAIDLSTDSKYLVSGRLDWRGAVANSCLLVVARRLEGDHVDYVARAARQIDQRGEIDWDEPETDEQRADEKAFDDEFKSKERVFQERRADQEEEAREYREKCRPKIPDQDRVQKFLKPDFRPNIPSRVASLLSYRDNGSVNYETGTFRIGDFGVYFGGTLAHVSMVNTMLKNGIVEVVKDTGHAETCLLKKGPNWDRAIEWAEEDSAKRRQKEREKESPPYVFRNEPKSRDEVPGEGRLMGYAYAPRGGSYDDAVEVYVKTPHGWFRVGDDKARQQLPDDGRTWELVGHKRFADSLSL